MGDYKMWVGVLMIHTSHFLRHFAFLQTSRTRRVRKSTLMSISGGEYHSIFIDCNKCVWGCGDNEYYQVGLNEGGVIEKPQPLSDLPLIIYGSAGGFHTLLIAEDGTVWGFGNGQRGRLGKKISTRQKQQIPTPTPVQAVSAGVSHSLFLDVDGHVWSCGLNECGQ